jgi:hypothetical protein
LKKYFVLHQMQGVKNAPLEKILARTLLGSATMLFTSQLAEGTYWKRLDVSQHLKLGNNHDARPVFWLDCKQWCMSEAKGL